MTHISHYFLSLYCIKNYFMMHRSIYILFVHINAYTDTCIYTYTYRKTQKLNFFTNQIYDRIALADERHLLGVRDKKLMIDKMVDDAGISYSYRSFYGIGPRKTTGGFIALEHTLNDKLGYDKRGIQNTYKIKVSNQSVKCFKGLPLFADSKSLSFIANIRVY